MHPRVSIVLASLLAAACSQLLGIDKPYRRTTEEQTNATGGAGTVDAGPPAADPPPDDPGSQGGAGGTPSELGPPPFESAGGELGQPMPIDDASSPLQCAAGHKQCGDTCEPMIPDFGCATLSCDPCITRLNAHAECGTDGTCESVCNDGYKPSGPDCVPMGTGGSEGTGGAPPSDGGDGGSGGNQPCDPLKCPACSRGFEGCCIPPIPGGPGSRCGCFYFPPLCTARVG